MSTTRLRGASRRFVGRNGKSRRREAAGGRNWPEAVPKNNERQKKDDMATLCRILREAKTRHGWIRVFAQSEFEIMKARNTEISGTASKPSFNDESIGVR